jgi:hypothetical protein
LPRPALDQDPPTYVITLAEITVYTTMPSLLIEMESC